jgi:RHH-type proline utilization regulon transcriptional repressor/proline dehydrogenase/delta 1-pyrroline-5-carboxylate dehydrogenase
VREAGKTLPNGQADLREAVDHLRYSAAQARQKFATPWLLRGPTGEANALSLHGRGVFACISPWNFPLAIFTGQIAGALAAGNSVAAKPAQQTPLVAARTVRLLHRARSRGRYHALEACRAERPPLAVARPGPRVD